MVDGTGTKVETVMRSVEVKTNWIIDVKIENDGESEDESHNGDENRQSLTSITKADAENGGQITMNLTAEEQQEQHAQEVAVPAEKRKAKWTEAEIHYVGALFDGGYDPESIAELLEKRFPALPAVSNRSVLSRRRNIRLNNIRHFREGRYNIRHLRESRLLAEQLGLETGQWSTMVLLLAIDNLGEQSSE